LFTTRPELAGTFGMVASTHWLASAVGMRILESGGNAFDAAVATGLTLHVVEPHLNGLGGDAPIIGHDAKSGDTFVICGQGPAPRALTREHFERLGLELIPGTGLLPAVVPGAFGAWMELLQRFGRINLRAIMMPAIEYALNGYPLVARAVDTISTVASLFTEHWSGSASTYLPSGKVPVPGARFSNPELGQTLVRILESAEAQTTDREGQIASARRAFYEGFVAEQIAEFVQIPAHDSSGTAHSGLLTYDDMCSWRPSYEAPESVPFGDFVVCKTAAWGQGPVLLQQLSVLSRLNIEDARPGTAEFMHAVIEGAKLAFADRDAYYGDPDFVDVPTRTLISSAYADARAVLIGREADPSFRPGVIDGFQVKWPTRIGGPDEVRIAGLGEPTVSRVDESDGDTCHVDVVDQDGNLVSATPSGGWLQSSPTIPGLGFALSTRGQMFWLEAGLPNSLEGGKRPRTTLSPGLVLRADGSPYLAFGTPGGDQQDQWTVPFLVNHLVHGMDLQEAIDHPTFHSTHVVSSFFPRSYTRNGVEVEGRMEPAAVAEMRARGHIVRVRDDWSLGRISAVGLRADGMKIAAANPRGMQGYAVGR
jgi:gamma-glutamyltranspeptidase/glutathione hydrolase